MKHAKLSASGSHRWLFCPGSVKAEEGLKDNGSFFASEGTCAHELAEIVLTKGGHCSDWVGLSLIENNQHTVDAVMADYVQIYVDYCRSIGGEMYIEHRLDFSQWVPNGFGTSDCVIVKGDTLHVIDLKYGKGVPVAAENNTQAMLYGLGGLDEFGLLQEIKHVKIAIVQPRLDALSEWEITASGLLAWGEWAAQRAEMACADDAERVPGEKQCLWCKAKPTCPSLADMTRRVLMVDFDSMGDVVKPLHMTDDQIASVMSAKKLIESWLASVEELVKSRCEDGSGFPGWKLVAGRSVRSWSDEAEAEKRLTAEIGQNAVIRKLISPAQAEKALGKSKVGMIADLITKSEGSPTLAPESDRRPPIGVKISDFDD